MIGMLIENRMAPDSDPDAELRVGAELMREALQLEGVEAYVDLLDRETGEDVVLTLFRDQVGLENFGAWAAANEARAHEVMNYEVVSSRTFSDVVHLMSGR